MQVRYSYNKKSIHPILKNDDNIIDKYTYLLVLCRFFNLYNFANPKTKFFI